MPEPKDLKLYKKVKEEVYKKYPKHSAYRSGILVKTYKSKRKRSLVEHTNYYKIS